jgi:charged multivesicular body protein 1
MKKGQIDNARVHAQNATRKRKDAKDLLNLAGRIDAVAGRVNTAATMQQVARGMDKAMKQMDPLKVRTLAHYESRKKLLEKADNETADWRSYGSLR